MRNIPLMIATGWLVAFLMVIALPQEFASTVGTVIGGWTVSLLAMTGIATIISEWLSTGHPGADDDD